MTTRRDKEETRQLLLETGLQMMLEQGLDVGWGVRLAEVTKRVGLTTGAAYQIWNGSRTKDGMGGQDRFHRDLALFAMNQLIATVSIDHPERMEELGDEGASIDLVLQTIAVEEFDSLMAGGIGFALFLGLLSSAESDEELAATAREGYRYITASYVDAYEGILKQHGLELRPPYTMEDLVVSIIAIGDGLCLRALVDPDAVPNDLPAPLDSAPDARTTWHRFGISIRIFFHAMTRPIGS